MYSKAMYSTKMYSKELVRGTLETIVLKLLAERKRMYGYEITQQVREITSGRIEITEGALYPTLHKLEAENLVQTEIVHIGKRVRKYYALTESGTAHATAKITEFTEFLDTMSKLMNLQPLGVHTA